MLFSVGLNVASNHVFSILSLEMGHVTYQLLAVEVFRQYSIQSDWSHIVTCFIYVTVVAACSQLKFL